MAPEQAAADPAIDHRADIYSFGVMAYELLAGEAPFHGRTPQKLLLAQMGERPVPIDEIRADTPPLLAQLIMTCLEKEPDDRPQSATELVRMLEQVTSGGGNSGDAGDSAWGEATARSGAGVLRARLRGSSDRDEGRGNRDRTPDVGVSRRCRVDGAWTSNHFRDCIRPSQCASRDDEFYDDNGQFERQALDDDEARGESRTMDELAASCHCRRRLFGGTRVVRARVHAHARLWHRAGGLVTRIRENRCEGSAARGRDFRAIGPDTSSGSVMTEAVRTDLGCPSRFCQAGACVGSWRLNLRSDRIRVGSPSRSRARSRSARGSVRWWMGTFGHSEGGSC